MNWNITDANSFCVSIILKNMEWYLSVMVKRRNIECLMYIFAGKVGHGTPIKFNKTLYHFWYK